MLPLTTGFSKLAKLTSSDFPTECKCHFGKYKQQKQLQTEQKIDFAEWELHFAKYKQLPPLSGNTNAFANAQCEYTLRFA